MRLAAILFFAPSIFCQEQLHKTLAIPDSHGSKVILTASSMERDLSSRDTEAIVHMKGNVEIRLITCVAPKEGEGVVCEGAMVLNADEARYNEKTGEIDAHGDVHITPHQPAK